MGTERDPFALKGGRLCVAICTYNRPRQLAALLEGLAAQDVEIPFPVVIVDNGTDAATPVIDRFRDRLAILSERIPSPGLAAVRNRALELALELDCEFLALIDDDEIPPPHWLRAFVECQRETGADLLFGPVRATFPDTAPEWVVEGGFFNCTGNTPDSANAFIRMKILPENRAKWFRPQFAGLGGEDADLFGRLLANGASKARADAAILSEDTPAERTTARYIRRRGLRDGAVAAQRIALRDDWAWHRKFRAGAWHALAKFGYGLNHLFWTPRTPWRFVRAQADFAAAWAVVAFACGRRYHFYGAPPAKVD